MHKRFNVAVVCESKKHANDDEQTFMTYTDSKMVRGRRSVYVATYMLVFVCDDCKATATIIEEV